jgi:hypothetical protein
MRKPYSFAFRSFYGRSEKLSGFYEKVSDERFRKKKQMKIIQDRVITHMQ